MHCSTASWQGHRVNDFSVRHDIRSHFAAIADSVLYVFMYYLTGLDRAAIPAKMPSTKQQWPCLCPRHCPEPAGRYKSTSWFCRLMTKYRAARKYRLQCCIRLQLALVAQDISGCQRCTRTCTYAHFTGMHSNPTLSQCLAFTAMCASGGEVLPALPTWAGSAGDNIC